MTEKSVFISTCSRRDLARRQPVGAVMRSRRGSMLPILARRAGIAPGLVVLVVAAALAVAAAIVFGV